MEKIESIDMENDANIHRNENKTPIGHTQYKFEDTKEVIRHHTTVLLMLIYICVSMFPCTQNYGS